MENLDYLTKTKIKWSIYTFLSLVIGSLLVWAFSEFVQKLINNDNEFMMYLWLSGLSGVFAIGAFSFFVYGIKKLWRLGSE